MCPATPQLWICLSKNQFFVLFVNKTFVMGTVQQNSTTVLKSKLKQLLLWFLLGLQCAVIEFARNVLHKEGANSIEVDPDTPHPVVIEMPEHNQGQLGGTMRLGKRETVFRTDDSIMKQLYGNQVHTKDFCRFPEFDSNIFTTFDGHRQKMVIQFLPLLSSPPPPVLFFHRIIFKLLLYFQYIF